MHSGRRTQPGGDGRAYAEMSGKRRLPNFPERDFKYAPADFFPGMSMKMMKVAIAVFLVVIIACIAMPAVALNPQPLPPGSQQLYTRYDPSAVQLNPQPLPPRTGYSPWSSQINPDYVQLNPQPLPPRQIGGMDRSTFQNPFPGQPGISYNPQTSYNPNTVPLYAQPSLSQQAYTGYNPATVPTSLYR